MALLGPLLVWGSLILVGAVVLLTVAVFIRFYWFNYATIVQDDLIMVRRMADWRTALYYQWDKFESKRTFRQFILWKDEITVERNINRRNPHVPLWIITYRSARTDHKIYISMYADGFAEVHERKNSPQWTYVPTREESLFLDAKYIKLISRAEKLQKDLKKKIKAVLKDR